MTYATDDVSQAAGAPIECYAFEGPNGNFYLTSYHDPITLNIGGSDQEFTPAPITRTPIELTTSVDSLVTMDFILPSTHEVCRRYSFTVSPLELFVTVYRQHLGNASTDYVIEHQGEATDFNADGNWSTIRTGSLLQSHLAGNTSAVLYQRSCNHFLGDDRCKVDLDLYKQTADVTAVQGTVITVDDDGAADDFFNGGRVVNTRTGEEQNIISNTANVIRIGYPLIDIIIGDTLDLFPGCNLLRLGDCKLKYNNVVNYGGFDFIPLKNPFEELNKEQQAQIVKTITEETIRKLRFPKEASS